jgi:ribosome-associated toxin RatA of RatAB toxin-antitoxin module
MVLAMALSSTWRIAIANPPYALRREGNIVEGEIQIAKAGFHKSFSTRNVVDPGGRISISLLDGPFKSLEGVWSFMPLREDASKISLELEGRRSD